jgi:hypothetical protein
MEGSMNKTAVPSAKSIGVIFLCVILVGAFVACKGKKTGDLKPVSKQEVYTIDVLKPVLGQAGDTVSGILDVTGDARELIITYRYYDDDQKNYDDDMVKDLAPKIEAMYRKFPGIHRSVFQVITNDPLAPGVWKPFVNFTLHRSIVEKVSWSGILTADFFKNVIELKRFD